MHKETASGQNYGKYCKSNLNQADCLYTVMDVYYVQFEFFTMHLRFPFLINLTNLKVCYHLPVSHVKELD